MALRRVLVGMLLASCGWWLTGQAALPAGTPRVPAPGVAAVPGGAGPLLKVEDADPAAQKAIETERLEILAVLNGPLAQTTITMTFRNHLARQLEGELEFPLPEGAAVVGYGLDVPAGSGTLAEGVAIEKERARQIFESEERRRVDPGVLEQTRGNNYRTRVHPIPAGGTRTVQITLVGDVSSAGNTATYKLPLDFVGKVKAAKIRVEVMGVKNPDAVRVDGMKNLAFKAAAGRLVAEQTFGNISLSGSLAIAAPLAEDAAYSVVETRAPEADGVTRPGMYFLVSVVAPVVPMKATVAPPGHVTIVWDTSWSRATADRSAEYETLRAILQTTHADFDIYGTDGLKLRSGKAAEAEAAIAWLKDVPCDGALNLDGVQQALDALPHKAEPCLVFSDGLVTLGRRELHPHDMTVYTICSDVRADHAYLRQVAEASGGMYLNLQRMKAADAAAAIAEPAWAMALESADAGQTKVLQVYPAGPVRVRGGERVTFAGELHANSAEAAILFGRLGGTMEKRWTVKLESPAGGAGGASTGMVARYWAQQKAAALAQAGPRGEDALLALAKEFRLVTPRTSLLVLETADQYVRYHVVPPKSRKDVYDEFNKRIEQEGIANRKMEQEKIDHIVKLWDSRVAWWNTTFSPPTKQQLAQAAAKQRQENAAEGVAPGITSAAPSAARPSAGMAGGAGARGGRGGGAGRAGSTGGGGFGGGGGGPGGGFGGEPDSAVRLQQQLADGTGAGRMEPSASITIKEWSPDTPYLRALTSAKADSAYATYLVQRKTFMASPAFYLDCANWFLEHKQREIGIKVLTDIAQLRLESAPLLRVAAYRLLQIGEYRLAIDLFEQAKALRPDEPQSWRDLAMATSEEALHRTWPERDFNVAEHERQVEDLLAAMALYNHVVMNKWERFDEIEVVALMEANALWEKIRALPGYEYVSKQRAIVDPLDSRLVKNLECDVRIVMTWDADDTDIDLHVIEPTGQEAFYGNNRTLAGGLVSRDFTQGYGPEEYMIHRAVPGTYQITANYFGSSQQALQGPVTVQATVITNFGRPNEKRQALTLRLTKEKETVPIGNIDFGK